MQSQQHFHTVTDSQDGVFNSYTGKLINLYQPTEDMIQIQDIGSALSKICRFGGHSSLFYSVAQHSVLVAALCGDELPKEALMHDAAEAYLGDVIKPLKIILGAGYADLEASFEAVISAKFGLASGKLIKARIKKYDLMALDLEHKAFIMRQPAQLLVAMNSLDLIKDDQYAWSSELAKMAFLSRYGELFS
ncbi:MAG: hypothetical protein Q8K66_04155 [Sediminibacterium sp.]|nr:hypothetical protein [Sediminibacterium sp.]MDP3128132.1 hypothetical protein [Sediminibacterium sp.]